MLHVEAGRGTEVEGRMRFSKLRIAVSTLCLIAGVLMIFVWAQSYNELNGIGLQLPKQGPAASRLHTTKLLVGVLVAIYVVGCIVVAFVPLEWWNRRRFSLKALLIVTTLIAAALGLAVYVARK